MKRLWMVLAAALFLGVTAPAMAEHDCKHDCEGKQCPMKKDDCQMCERSHGKDECQQCPILSKTLKKSGWLLDNADELGLSDDQIKKVREIKMAAKKDAIRMEAEMKIAHMEMESALSQDKIDAAALGAMMDQGMAAWAQQGKAAIQRYAELKDVLSPEQRAKARSLKADREGQKKK